MGKEATRLLWVGIVIGTALSIIVDSLILERPPGVIKWTAYVWSFIALKKSCERKNEN